MLQNVQRLDWPFISSRICQHLKKILHPHTAGIVAGYNPQPHEPDIMPFLEFWLQQNGTCCLPVVSGPQQPLVFREWHLSSSLIPGLYGIGVPNEQQPLLIPEVVLVPLLAFDQQGYRLGRGGGYYDRTLSYLRQKNPQCQMIGVAAQAQFTKTLPIDKHDQHLDRVVTEQGMRQF